jgi:Na+-transporting methylmalonyl-CoA/oxaloacetate decarboxylase gamma subunit
VSEEQAMNWTVFGVTFVVGFAAILAWAWQVGRL